MISYIISYFGNFLAFLSLYFYDAKSTLISVTCDIFGTFICFCLQFHWLMISVPYDIIQFHDILSWHLAAAPHAASRSFASSGLAIANELGTERRRTWSRAWTGCSGRLEAALVKRWCRLAVVEQCRLAAAIRVRVAFATWNLKRQTGSGARA